jgi:hypothetical protein
VHGSSGSDIGVFDRRSGSLVTPLSLPQFGHSATGGVSVGPPGSLLYDASDPGPQDGTGLGPRTGCSGDLYRVNRLTGRAADVLHDASRTFGPLAAARDGSYAVSSENCRETEHGLTVMVRGKRVPASARVVGTDPLPLDWSRDGRELLVLSQPATMLVRLTRAGLVLQRSLSSTQGQHCWLDAAVFDAFGILEAQGCSAHGHEREQLVQLRGSGSRVMWRHRTPMDGVADVDTDVAGRSVLLTGDCHGRCGDGPLTYAVLIGQLSRHGVTLRQVPIGRRFVDSATF